MAEPVEEADRMDEWPDKLREIAESTWVRRGVIGAYVALLAGVIGAYIGVSLVEVQTSAYIRGDATLQRGRPNAIRGVILDAPTGTYRRNVTVRFELRRLEKGGGSGDADRETSNAKKDSSFEIVGLGEARPGRNGVIQTTLDVPSEIEKGEWELVLWAEGERIETFERATDVEVVESRAEGDVNETWLSSTSRVVGDSTREKSRSGPVAEQNGDLAVELLPPDGELVGGVGSTVFIRTSDAETGEPVPAEVRFETLEGRAGWPNRDGPPAVVETDRFGLAGFDVSAATDLRWTLKARELGDGAGGDGSEDDDADKESLRRGETVLQLYTVPAQMDLTLERVALFGDRKLRAKVESLFGEGEVLVDLFRGEDWLYAGAAPLRDRSSNFALTIPEPVRPEMPAWFRVQVSRHVYGADETWDAAHFVVIPSGEDRQKSLGRAVTDLAELIADNRDEDDYFAEVAARAGDLVEGASDRSLERWVRALSAGLPRHFEHSDVLFNTQKADRAALASWRRRVKDDLFDVVVVALAGALAVILYVVTLGVRRHRKHARHLRDVDAELPEDLAEVDAERVDTSDTEVGQEGMRVVLLGVVAMSAFVMFGLGLLLVLSYL